MTLAQSAGKRFNIMEALIALMIDNRLKEAYYQGAISQVDPPKFSTFTYNRVLRYYGTNWQGDNLVSASTDYMSVLLTAQKHGFNEDDMSRAVKRVEISLQYQIKSDETTQVTEYAQRYENHFFDGASISQIKDYSNRVLNILKTLKVNDLTVHYRQLMQQTTPLVIAVGASVDELPSVAELNAAIRSAQAGPPPKRRVKVTQLMDRPTASHVALSRPLDFLGKNKAYEWVFYNGVSVTFIPSGISKERVNLYTRSFGGWSLMQPGDRAISSIALQAVTNSGVGGWTPSQIKRFLEEKVISVAPYISETSEGFSGSAASDDAETLFQLLHLMVTAPQINEQAFQNAMNTAKVRSATATVNPNWQAALAYIETRFGLSWHMPVATAAQLEQLTPEALLAIYEKRLGNVDDMHVMIVGDIEAADVEEFRSPLSGHSSYR